MDIFGGISSEAQRRNIAAASCAANEAIREMEVAIPYLEKWGVAYRQEVKQGGSRWVSGYHPTGEAATREAYAAALRDGYRYRKHWWQIWLPALPDEVRDLAA